MADGRARDPGDAGGAPNGRNQLALASFLLSLIFVIGAGLHVMKSGIVVMPHWGALAIVLNIFGIVFDIVGVPAAVAAVVTGHVALGRAKEYRPRQARRGLAIAGLVIGYLSLAVFVVLAGVVIWLFVTHGIVIQDMY